MFKKSISCTRGEQNENNDNLLDSESDVDLFEVLSKENNKETHLSCLKRTSTGDRRIKSRFEAKNSKMKPSHSQLSHGMETLNKGHSFHESFSNFIHTAATIKENEVVNRKRKLNPKLLKATSCVINIDDTTDSSSSMSEDTTDEHEFHPTLLKSASCVITIDDTTDISSSSLEDTTDEHYVPAKRVKTIYNPTKDNIKDVRKSQKRVKRKNGLYSSYVKLTDFMKTNNVPTYTKQVNYNTRSAAQLNKPLEYPSTVNNNELSQEAIEKTNIFQPTIKNPLRSFRIHRNDDSQNRDKHKVDEIINSSLTTPQFDEKLQETNLLLKNNQQIENFEEGKVNETSSISLQFIIDQLIEETSSESSKSVRKSKKQSITSLEHHITDYTKSTTSNKIEYNIENCDDDESSNLSLQMSEDSLNVKMAAEALSLLRNNGRTASINDMEEYVKNGSSVASSSAPEKCSLAKPSMTRNLAQDENELNVSHKQIIVENAILPSSMELPNVKYCPSHKNENQKPIPLNAQNSSSCTFSEEKKTRHRLQFDSTLEITDAITGAKISLESIYFNSNDKLQSNAKSEQYFLPESLLQLSDTVTCVKVTMDQKEEEANTSQRFPTSPAVNAVNMDDNVVCVQIPLHLIQQSNDKSPKAAPNPDQKSNDAVNSVDLRISEEVSNCKNNPPMLQTQTKSEVMNAETTVKISKIEPLITDTGRKLSLEPILIRNKNYIAQIQKAEESQHLAPPTFLFHHDNNKDEKIQEVDDIEEETIISTQKCSFDDNATKMNMYIETNSLNPLSVPKNNEVQIELERLIRNTVDDCTDTEDSRFSSNTNEDQHSIEIRTSFQNESPPSEYLRIEENESPSNILKEAGSALINDTNTKRERTMSEIDLQISDSINLKIEIMTSQDGRSINSRNEDQLVKSERNVRKERSYSEEQQSLLTNEYATKKRGRTSHSQQMEEIRKALHSQEFPSFLTRTFSDFARPINNGDIGDESRESQEQNVEEIFNKKQWISENQYFEQNGNSEELHIAIKTVTTPLESFSLLINDNMIGRILKYTNVKLEKLASKSKHRSCFKKPTNETELKAFLGLLLISGALKQNQTTVPEIWSECFGAGIFRATLNEPRFQSLSHGICFGDSTSRDECIISNEFTQISDLWEEYLINCKKYSIPSQTKQTEKTVNSMVDPDGDDEPRQLYSTARKTVNMSLRKLFSMLDGAGVRGLAIFRYYYPTVKISQREFLKQVGMSLVKPHMRIRLLKPTLRKPIKDLIESILDVKNENEQSVKSPTDNVLKKQKRCQLCPWKEDRKTKYQCESCQRAMCKDHRSDFCIDCIC